MEEMERIQEAAFRKAKQILKDEEAARDVAQEVLILIWEKRKEVKDIGIGYAVRIARNLSCMVIKDLARRKALFSDIDYMETVKLHAAVDTVYEMLDAKHRGEIKRKFKRDLQRLLSEATRDQIFIWEMRKKGESYKAISEKLQGGENSPSESKCRSLHYHFRRRLKRHLKPYETFLPFLLTQEEISR